VKAQEIGAVLSILYHYLYVQPERWRERPLYLSILYHYLYVERASERERDLCLSTEREVKAHEIGERERERERER
jgi:hypothetical protein